MLGPIFQCVLFIPSASAISIVDVVHDNNFSVDIQNNSNSIHPWPDLGE